jgi:hypothetical protein
MGFPARYAGNHWCDVVSENASGTGYGNSPCANQ